MSGFKDYCRAAVSLILLALLIGCTSPQESQKDDRIEISGIKYSADSTDLVLSSITSSDFPAMSEFKSLQSVDITSSDITAEDFDSLRNQLGEHVVIKWSVPFNGQKYSNEMTELTVPCGISSNELSKIRYFGSLKKLTVTDCTLSENLYNVIKASTDFFPELDIDCHTKIYDVDLDYHTELLNLNNIQIASLDDLCLALEIFPNIKSVEMCDCGLSNQIMQGLREEYPGIKFVWMITFLNYKVRTDIQVFSTLANNLSRPGNSETYAPLFKYCTELRALDLGHMAISDLSEIRNLKKLHTLILADNYISDISPLADLKDLVYIELFFNRISDVSPLLELPNLEDLNLCYNRRLSNATLLTGCKQLKKLYISNCNLSADEIATLKNGIPADCDFNYTAGNAIYNGGWRTTDNARNTKIREAFANWKKVKEYPTWDNIIYFE